MFSAFRSLPGWARIPLQILASPFLVIGWVIGEMFGQATRSIKKALAPLLWPAATILFFVAAYFVLGPQGFKALVGPILILVIALYGLKIMVFNLFGLFKSKKKKKK